MNIRIPAIERAIRADQIRESFRIDTSPQFTPDEIRACREEVLTKAAEQLTLHRVEIITDFLREEFSQLIPGGAEMTDELLMAAVQEAGYRVKVVGMKLKPGREYVVIYDAAGKAVTGLEIILFDDSGRKPE